MRVGFRCGYINHHGDHWLFERNVADAQSWNWRRDVLLEHLLKPDFGIDTSVYAVVEAGWLVVMLGHAVDDLAAVCISKRTDISRLARRSAPRPRDSLFSAASPAAAHGL